MAIRARAKQQSLVLAGFDAGSMARSIDYLHANPVMQTFDGRARNQIEMLKRCIATVLSRVKAARCDAFLGFQGDLERLLNLNDSQLHFPQTVATELPVLGHLEMALAEATKVDPELGGALAALSSQLQWRQNPNYVRNPPSADFLSGYGYAVIAGSGGLFPARIAFGLLILAPGILYPAHLHPAEEVYLVLDQTSLWWREGEEWRHGLAGALIHHPPNLLHAMQAGLRPLCAVYLWRGAIEVNAVLRSDRPPSPLDRSRT